MKRTGEIVLSIIGLVIYAFMAILGFFMVTIMKSDEVMGEIESGMQNDPAVSSAEINDVIDIAGSYGWSMVIVTILAIILGIVAVVFLKRNHRPTVAGIILLVTAVVGSIFSLPFGIFGGLFYLIAGIMCFARKPKPELQ